jgi:hypothetical protein
MQAWAMHVEAEATRRPVSHPLLTTYQALPVAHCCEPAHHQPAALGFPQRIAYTGCNLASCWRADTACPLGCRVPPAAMVDIPHQAVARLADAAAAAILRSASKMPATSRGRWLLPSDHWQTRTMAWYRLASCSRGHSSCQWLAVASTPGGWLPAAAHLITSVNVVHALFAHALL